MFEFHAREDRNSPAPAMKTPGGGKPPGASKIRENRCLEHAEYNGADKGECDIRGDNAQSAKEGTEEGHRDIFLVRVCPWPKASKPPRAGKVSLAVARGFAAPGDVVKES